MYEKVLVPVDGSAPSLKAVAAARKLAEAGVARQITIINVVHFPTPAVLADGLSLNYFPAQYQNELITVAETITEKAREQLGPDINAKIIIDSGSPPDVILQAAEKDNYDLIIMGNRGLNQVQRLFLGSVSNRVVLMSKCSVLIVKD